MTAISVSFSTGVKSRLSVSLSASIARMCASFRCASLIHAFLLALNIFLLKQKKYVDTPLQRC